MGIFIKIGILHTLKFHLHTLSCHFWLNLWVNSTYFFKITNQNQHASELLPTSNIWQTLLRNIEHVSAVRNWQIFWCASRQASTCRSGGRHLGKFAWGSNLALFFEALQSRPSMTFTESWHDYWNNILEVLVEGFVSPILQIGDIDKIMTETNGRCESGRHFLVEYRHHLRPRMDGIVCKTYQTYNSLPPCQEIDI